MEKSPKPKPGYAPVSSRPSFNKYIFEDFCLRKLYSVVTFLYRNDVALIPNISVKWTSIQNMPTASLQNRMMHSFTAPWSLWAQICSLNSFNSFNLIYVTWHMQKQNTQNKT